MVPYTEIKAFNPSRMKVDEISLDLYPQDVPQLLPIDVYGDGNCLPRCGSVLAFGDEEHHKELRVRIVFELVENEDLYLSNDFLAQGTDFKELPKTYVSYAGRPEPLQMTCEGLKQAFHREVMSIRMPAAYIWVCGRDMP